MQYRKIKMPFFQLANSFDLVEPNIIHDEIDSGSPASLLPAECDRHRPDRLKAPHAPTQRKKTNNTIHAAIKLENILKIPSLKSDISFIRGCTLAYPQPGLTISIQTASTPHRLSKPGESNWSLEISSFRQPRWRIPEEKGIKRQVVFKKLYS